MRACVGKLGLLKLTFRSCRYLILRLPNSSLEPLADIILRNGRLVFSKLVYWESRIMAPAPPADPPRGRQAKTVIPISPKMTPAQVLLLLHRNPLSLALQSLHNAHRQAVFHLKQTGMRTPT